MSYENIIWKWSMCHNTHHLQPAYYSTDILIRAYTVLLAQKILLVHDNNTLL